MATSRYCPDHHHGHESSDHALQAASIVMNHHDPSGEAGFLECVAKDSTNFLVVATQERIQDSTKSSGIFSLNFRTTDASGGKHASSCLQQQPPTGTAKLHETLAPSLSLPPISCAWLPSSSASSQRIMNLSSAWRSPSMSRPSSLFNSEGDCRGAAESASFSPSTSSSEDSKETLKCESMHTLIAAKIEKSSIGTIDRFGFGKEHLHCLSKMVKGPKKSIDAKLGTTAATTRPDSNLDPYKGPRAVSLGAKSPNNALCFGNFVPRSQKKIYRSRNLRSIWCLHPRKPRQMRSEEIIVHPRSQRRPANPTRSRSFQKVKPFAIHANPGMPEEITAPQASSGKISAQKHPKLRRTKTQTAAMDDKQKSKQSRPRKQQKSPIDYTLKRGMHVLGSISREIGDRTLLRTTKKEKAKAAGDHADKNSQKKAATVLAEGTKGATGRPSGRGSNRTRNGMPQCPTYRAELRHIDIQGAIAHCKNTVSAL